MFCDLDTSAVNHDRAAILAAEFLVWWHQAGRFFYGDDEGLAALANDAVAAVGGRGAARKILSYRSKQQQEAAMDDQEREIQEVKEQPATSDQGDGSTTEQAPAEEATADESTGG